MRNVLCDFDFVSHLPTSNVKESKEKESLSRFFQTVDKLVDGLFLIDRVIM